MRAAPTPLERIWLEVPEHALEPYESALRSACETVGFFRDQTSGNWQIEGVRAATTDNAPLAAALALAEALTGLSSPLHRQQLNPEGWLERSYAAFPEQLIGRRFAIRGSHIVAPPIPGRVTLLLDAGMAFGSGEHGSTRGCLIALERIAGRKPRHILDLGTGSGILAIAAARLLHRCVLATDIDPWSVRLARSNAHRNHVGPLIRTHRANGWQNPLLTRHTPYDLILANILAHPLALMARVTARRLAPGGTVVLSGLLFSQSRSVLVAHRRHGLRLAFQISQPPWTTLVIKKALPGSSEVPHQPAPRQPRGWLAA
jgi:ribosomal protein L11 methyltransferase